ncbi:MAG TPA: hypothetical protein VMD02_03925 [Candidatus Omnitrophota bacterium]|nr:hypothetical protein [Candidatus Omnitrophota bacterium]
MPDIRDIKDVIGVFDFASFVFVVLCVIALLAIGYFVYLKVRGLRRMPGAEQEHEPEKTFQQKALEKLGALDPALFFEKGIIKEFYLEMTEAVRVFLSENYHIDTLDRTSFEIIGELERAERDYEKVKFLDRYFDGCDLVKFAKRRPMLAEMREAKEQSIRIVKEFYKANAVR